MPRTHLICKPIDTWPGKRRTTHERSQFSAGWTATVEALDRELAHLRASSVILEIDVTDADLRNDGWPRAHVNVPPAVKLSFTSAEHGPMVYATDKFHYWQDNVRAIALGLEALRKVDRYGITDSGQQYAGYKQLGAGTPLGTSRDSALFELMEILANATADDRWMDDHRAVEIDLDNAFKIAKSRTHPDVPGGDEETFKRVGVLEQIIR